MIDKRVNVAKRLKDYKDILEAFKKEADNKAHPKLFRNTDFEADAYYEGMAAAYRIALTFFKEYLEKIVIKKERRKENE